MTARITTVVLVAAVGLFVLPVGVSSERVTVTPPLRWEPGLYGDLPKAVLEGLTQGEEGETALAAIRVWVQMYPEAFPPGFLNTVTASTARGILPVVEFRVREYLATERAKATGQR